MKPLFAWIQLSDIHVGHGDAAHGWDQALVMDALRRDIEAVVSAGDRADDDAGCGAPRPDAIFVTGDIAFSGNCRVRPPDTESREYARAKELLLGLGRAAGLDADAIFVVPGNHDVQRDGDRRGAVRRLLKALRSGDEDIDTALTDPEDRALLAARFSSYRTFAKGFAPACIRPSAAGAAAPLAGPAAAAIEPSIGELSWCHRTMASGGLRLRLVGLNTALLAADDQDRGRLRVGNEMLARALVSPPIPADELVVVLSHHPLRGGWLSDEWVIDAWVRSHAHIHLSGHVHEADVEHSRSGAGASFVRVAAGAVHGEQAAPGVPAGHGYNFAAVTPGESRALTLRVWPRKWSERRKAFTLDIENVPEGRSFSEHEIRPRAIRQA